MDKTKTTINNTLILAGIVVAASILYSTRTSNYLNQLFFNQNSKLTLIHQDQKLILIRHISMYLSLFIFVPTMLIMLIRIIGRKPSPATQEDPLPIRVLNRIISNSIEQSIIFLGLYSYYLFDKFDDRFQSRQLILLASWFLMARAAYGSAYLIGQLIGFTTIKAMGFAINVAVQLLLIDVCFSEVGWISFMIFGK